MVLKGYLKSNCKGKDEGEVNVPSWIHVGW
jgi:hypothetical protein